MRDLTPVILLAGLKEALTEGGQLEVECIEAAEKFGNTFRGGWKVFVRIGVQRAVYVVSRNIEPKVFKTVTGLVSFAMDNGFSVVGVPLRVGERVEWVNGAVPERNE